MKARFRRTEPGRRENLGAALVSTALAAGVGLVVFYFTRLFLSREAIGGEAKGEGTDVLRGQD